METHILDAKNKILGRLAVEAANLLRGKHKADFANYLNCGDKVIIINTDKIRLTGRKLEQKVFYRHTMYLGHLKAISLKSLMAKDTRLVVRKAIYGMLPKNKLRDKIIKKLILYKGEQKNSN